MNINKRSLLLLFLPLRLLLLLFFIYRCSGSLAPSFLPFCRW